MSEEATIEELVNDLDWWQRWLAEIPKRFKDDPDTLKRQLDSAKKNIERLRKLIADRRSGRGDRTKKEEEAERRRLARKLPKRKK